jgi:ABC-2 type transport system permease protein
MPSRRELAALAAFAALGWRQATTAPLALAGRAALYVVVLAIFRQLWLATPLGEAGGTAPSAADLLWYLAITEWIVFTGGIPYREVESDIVSGQIAVALQRPVPYGAATLARWSGGAAWHLIVLGAVGFTAGWLFAGPMPLRLAEAPVLALAGVVGTALILLCQLQLGYLAAWLGSAAPAFWIWQKLAFVLGGLIMPLTLYPAPWRAIAERTPFAAMLFAPGSLAFGRSDGIVVLGAQLLWLVLLGGLAVLIERALVARLLRDGA